MLPEGFPFHQFNTGSVLAWVPHLYTFQGLPGSIISLVSGIVTASCIPVPGQALWRPVVYQYQVRHCDGQLYTSTRSGIVMASVCEPYLSRVSWTPRPPWTGSTCRCRTESSSCRLDAPHTSHCLLTNTHTYGLFLLVIFYSKLIYIVHAYYVYIIQSCVKQPPKGSTRCLLSGGEYQYKKLKLGNILYGCLIKVTTNSGLNVYQPKCKKCYTDTVKMFWSTVN